MEAISCSAAPVDIYTQTYENKMLYVGCVVARASAKHIEQLLYIIFMHTIY